MGQSPKFSLTKLNFYLTIYKQKREEMKCIENKNSNPIKKEKE